MKDRVTGLNGKRIVLLDGTSGVGFATALAVSEEGAKIVVVSSNYTTGQVTVVDGGGVLV